MYFDETTYVYGNEIKYCEPIEYSYIIYKRLQF